MNAHFLVTAAHAGGVCSAQYGMDVTDACLASETDLAGFRAESRDLLAHQVHPDMVQWSTRQPLAEELREVPQTAAASRPRSVARAATAIVPASFLRLCESVVLHRDPARFGLLYRLLWRLVHEPQLRNDALDPDMTRAQHMAHAVRRDLHKMKTSLHFIPFEGLEAAFFEPSHHVLEVAAPWFARRFTEQPWVIFTPERSVRFDGRSLVYAPGVPRQQVPRNDAPREAWQACIDEVFRTVHPA
jgi:uracil-DNA glycosylase